LNNLRLEQLRIRHLKFVVLLAALGTLAATAEQLSMTPSAASMMLKEIESLFGATLFQRKGRGMTPTEQGLALLRRCQTILGEVDAMGSTLTEVGAPLLRLGAFPHTTTTLLPKIINSLITATPGWRVQLVDDRAESLSERLLSGEIDLLLGRLPSGFANRPVIAEIEQRVLYMSGLAVVARRGHALARHRNVPLSELLQWPWVLPAMTSTTRMALIDAFLQEGLPPPIPRVESPSYFYSLSLVGQSDLLTYCAHTAILEKSDETVILPVKIGAGAMPVSLLWRRSSIEADRAVRHLETEVLNDSQLTKT
jgi:DNA-binding transcriptional LysR family regulator